MEVFCIALGLVMGTKRRKLSWSSLKVQCSGEGEMCMNMYVGMGIPQSVCRQGKVACICHFAHASETPKYCKLLQTWVQSVAVFATIHTRLSEQVGHSSWYLRKRRCRRRHSRGS